MLSSRLKQKGGHEVTNVEWILHALILNCFRQKFVPDEFNEMKCNATRLSHLLNMLNNDNTVWELVTGSLFLD